METAKLPAITSREERLVEQKDLHAAEMKAMTTKLSGVKAELEKSKANVTRLESELRNAPKVDKLRGAGLAVVALSTLGKSRASKVTAFAGFQPYALSFIANRSFISSRPLQLPRIESVMEDFALAKKDFETATNAPPILLGGSTSDAALVRDIFKGDISQFRDVMCNAHHPYRPALLWVFFRRLQIRHQEQAPNIAKIFGSARQFVGAKRYTTETLRDDCIAVGLINHGTCPNVYSWHPLEKLLVVYTWSGLEKANIATPVSLPSLLRLGPATDWSDRR